MNSIGYGFIYDERKNNPNRKFITTTQIKTNNDKINDDKNKILFSKVIIEKIKEITKPKKSN
jgi:hypothetical protein